MYDGYEWIGNLNENADVSVEIYNILGMKVTDLTNKSLNAGNHSVIWNSGKFDNGVYMVKVKIGGDEVVKRVVKVE